MLSVACAATISQMPETMKIQPVSLAGARVRLEPLHMGHLDALCEVGLEETIWRWFPVPVRSRKEMAE